jgi:hypothetical protein
MYRAVERPELEDKTNQIPDYLASPNNIPRIKLAIFFFRPLLALLLKLLVTILGQGRISMCDSY